jgi:hypothetical protein
MQPSQQCLCSQPMASTLKQPLPAAWETAPTASWAPPSAAHTKQRGTHARQVNRTSVEHVGLHQSTHKCQASHFSAEQLHQATHTDNPIWPWQNRSYLFEPHTPEAGHTPRRMPRMKEGPLHKAHCCPQSRKACAAWKYTPRSQSTWQKHPIQHTQIANSTWVHHIVATVLLY